MIAFIVPDTAPADSAVQHNRTDYWLESADQDHTRAEI